MVIEFARIGGVGQETHDQNTLWVGIESHVGEQEIVPVVGDLRVGEARIVQAEMVVGVALGIADGGAYVGGSADEGGRIDAGVEQQELQ
ncbi:hypothetical protein D9M69_628720 [compost metagenome]